MIQIYLVTSDDFLFAPRVFEYLRKRHEVTFLNITKDPDKRDLKSFIKKIKLSFLFGFLNSIHAFASTYRNKKALTNGPKKYGYKQLDVNQFHSFVYSEKSAVFILLNYPWLVKLNKSVDNLNVLNCHPSSLPSFRGLMPICWQVLDSFIGPRFKLGISLHLIDEFFDSGSLVAHREVSFPKYETLYGCYHKHYLRFGGLISKHLNALTNQKERPDQKKLPNNTRYYTALGWNDVIRLKVKLFLQSYFFRFLLNGGVIGLVSWILQIIFLKLLVGSGVQLEISAFFSVWMAFIFSIILSFFSLRSFVFLRGGSFILFCMATTLMILIVSVITASLVSVFRPDSYSGVWSYLAYPIAALLCAPLSFFIKKHFVFRKDRNL